MNPTSQSSSGGNVFGELVSTVEVCLVAHEAESGGGPCRVETKGEDGSLGQISACLTGVVGKFRPMV
jgi:hypothetical protein